MTSPSSLLSEADADLVCELRRALVGVAGMFASKHSMAGHLAVMALGEALALGMTAHVQSQRMNEMQQGQLLLDVVEGLTHSYALKVASVEAKDTAPQVDEAVTKH